jgi:two-component system, OmpR family, KDP operon response regulator KdpE
MTKPLPGVQRGTLLVVDDEPQIRRAVRNTLAAEFARVVEVENGSTAVDVAAAERPDFVILDLGLPDGPGIAVCRELRKWLDAPILVLSARHADAEKVALLDAGADDYVTKPFSADELRARVRAHLRRVRAGGNAAPNGTIVRGDLAVDFDARVVRRQGAPVHLTPTEWDLLRAMVAHAGRTLTHRQLFAAVWGNASGDAQQYLRVHVAALRRKLEPDPVHPRLIHTEPGVGYRLELDA